MHFDDITWSLQVNLPALWGGCSWHPNISACRGYKLLASDFLHTVNASTLKDHRVCLPEDPDVCIVARLLPSGDFLYS